MKLQFEGRKYQSDVSVDWNGFSKCFCYFTWAWFCEAYSWCISWRWHDAQVRDKHTRREREESANSYLSSFSPGFGFIACDALKNRHEGDVYLNKETLLLSRRCYVFFLSLSCNHRFNAQHSLVFPFCCHASLFGQVCRRFQSRAGGQVSGLSAQWQAARPASHIWDTQLSVFATQDLKGPEFLIHWHPLTSIDIPALWRPRPAGNLALKLEIVRWWVPPRTANSYRLNFNGVLGVSSQLLAKTAQHASSSIIHIAMQ